MIFAQYKKKFSTEGKIVSLEEILTARENRRLLQQECLKKYQHTLLSLTLIAPGPVKNNELLDYVFEKSLEKLKDCFADLKIKPKAKFIRYLETGHEALFILPTNANHLKLATITLEDNSKIARLWDIDVIDEKGNLLSRKDFGFGPRVCLVCQDDAKICAKSAKHSLLEITNKMQQLACQAYFIEQIGDLAYYALLKEAYLTPKPGLVDNMNNGAHKDMNIHTFELSAKALRPYFSVFVEKGIETAHLAESEVLSHIRSIGISAEQAMFDATNGINTHKGAIFIFGLVCTAIGRLYCLSSPKNTCHSQEINTQIPLHIAKNEISLICQLVTKFTQGIVLELHNYPDNLPQTAGVKVFRAYGLTGARGEAEAGFPLVRKYLYMEYSHKDNNEVHHKISPLEIELEEHFLLILLLHLISENQDTNIAHRGGIDSLLFVQKQAKNLLDDLQIYHHQDLLKQRLIEFDKICTERNVSPGGSADLLALIIFFSSLVFRGNKNVFI